MILGKADIYSAINRVSANPATPSNPDILHHITAVGAVYEADRLSSYDMEYISHALNTLCQLGCAINPEFVLDTPDLLRGRDFLKEVTCSLKMSPERSRVC